MFATTGGVPTRRARGSALLLALLASTGGSLILAPAAYAVPPAATITIEVEPGTVTEGESVEVTVDAAGVTDLYAYDLVISFDPALLAFETETATGPDGGFTATAPGDGLVSLTHTRLGTSPGLADAVELATLSFTALAAGDATISLDSAELVGSTGETAILADIDTATVSITALPDPAPSGSATPSPGATPSPSASGATPSPTTTAARPSPSPSSAIAGRGSDRISGGPLASTGADPTPWLIGAAGSAAVIALGLVLVLHRRRAVSE